MRLAFASQAEAQAVADRIHAEMASRYEDYANSVRTGQTTAWAKPYQDLDDNGVPISTLWYINLKDRSLDTLTAGERTDLLPYRSRA